MINLPKEAIKNYSQRYVEYVKPEVMKKIRNLAYTNPFTNENISFDTLKEDQLEVYIEKVLIYPITRVD